MSLKPSEPRSKRIRHRITEIELIPSTSNRKLSAKVLINDEVVCELPWVKSGQPLRWKKLIVYDGFDDSKIALEVCEKHSIKDRRFRSDAFTISSVRQQSEVTVGLSGFSWNARFKLLTQATAEKYFAAGLDKLREMKSIPSTLEKLGEARPVFRAMLQLGSEIFEIYPTAKMVFVICAKAWEKLETQQECDENMRELLAGLGGILDIVELVKKHARTDQLQETIGEFLILVEDVSIYAAERAELTNSTGRALRGLLDSKEQGNVKALLRRFERLRAELEIGIGAETHSMMDISGLHRLLDQLQPIVPSGYDSSRACQDGTRERIISDIISWTKQYEPHNCLLWVYGQAGIGKSSIATSVCQQLANDKVLAASFFCKRDDPGLRDPLRLINSVAHGLATHHPPYAQAVALAIQKDRELCMAHMDIRYKGLIKEPLQALANPGITRPMIVLVDAVDECGTDASRHSLLKHMYDMSQLVPWLKLVITSRPDGDMQETFQDWDKARVSSRNVHDFDASEDIRAYIEKELGGIARRHRWDEGSIEKLCEKAGGVFIWAATVKNYLTVRGSSVPRLHKVIHNQKSTVSDHMDILYRSVILAGMKDSEDDQKALFRQCIGVVIAASTRQPLPISSLGALLLEQLDPIALEEVIGSLDAVLYLDRHHGGAVRCYHPSFSDYATDSTRSGDLYVHPAVRNTELAAGCLKTMERELRFNICQLETSYLLNNEVLDLAERRKSNISSQLEYACTYWISHLIDTPSGTLTSEVEALINSPRILYWLEVLSLTSRVDVGLQGLHDLQEWLPKHANQLLELVEDMYRFTLAFYEPISSSTPHIYVSALAFAPDSAQVVRRFRPVFSNTVNAINGDPGWPRWLTALVHPAKVFFIAVSPDGRLLVSACTDNALRLWDIRSGTMVGKPLLGHSELIASVAFSSDNNFIASGSADMTLRLWNAKTGVAMSSPFVGHTVGVSSVAFSPDNRWVASGSLDQTICLWDTKLGAKLGDPLIHPSPVMSLAFSPDGRYIISSCFFDPTVWVWDTTATPMVGNVLLRAVGAYTVRHAAFSPDGTRIFYGLPNALGTVQWNNNAGTVDGEPLVRRLSTVNYHSLDISPNGDFVVTCDRQGTVEIWDIERDSMNRKQLMECSGGLNSVAFLPDGRRVATGSNDGTVRLWDIRPRPGTTIHKPQHFGHSDGVNCVAFSPDGSRIISGSKDSTIRIWDSRTGAMVVEPFPKHSDIVSFVTFSPNGDYIVSGSYDKTVRLWDAQSGAAIGEPLVTHTSAVTSVAVSADGTRIVSGLLNGTIAITPVAFPLDRTHFSPDPNNAMQNPGAGASRAKKSQLSHHQSVISLAFSPDGRRIVSGSADNKICLWDAMTGTLICGPLIGHSRTVIFVAFSPDSSRIISASRDKTVIVWDVELGIEVEKLLLADPSPIWTIAFSPDGNYIASGSESGTIRFWDRKSGAAIGEPFVGYTGLLTSMAFSPDGSRLTSACSTGFIRVWDAKAGTRPSVSDLATPSYPSQRIIPEHPNHWPPLTHALPSHPKYSGWASLDGKSLLFWLPSHYRRTYSPNMLYIIPADQFPSMIRLDFSKFVHGSDWTSVACDEARRNLL